MSFPSEVRCVGAFCILTTAKPQPHVWMYKSGQRLQVMALPEKAVGSHMCHVEGNPCRAFARQAMRNLQGFSQRDKVANK